MTRRCSDDMSVFDKKNMPPEVSRIGARRAKLAISVVEHNMRQTTLANVAAGDSHESMHDIERWIDEECAYTENGVVMAAMDLQTLDRLHDGGQLSDEDYADLEKWVSDDVEQMYRDYAALKENVVEIDRHFDSEFIRKVEAVFETEAKREAIPFEDMSESLSRYANFGDMGA